VEKAEGVAVREKFKVTQPRIQIYENHDHPVPDPQHTHRWRSDRQIHASPPDPAWPRQRTNEQGRLIYYQPQVDAWTNFKDLAFRMAFSLTEAATPDPAALQLKRFPNSVDTLAPNNRFVVAINKIPITPGIPYYTILGDRGRGDSPNSSDGVVLTGAVTSMLPGANLSRRAVTAHLLTRKPSPKSTAFSN
jgi:hypothetical protein